MAKYAISYNGGGFYGGGGGLIKKSLPLTYGLALNKLTKLTDRKGGGGYGA